MTLRQSSRGGEIGRPACRQAGAQVLGTCLNMQTYYVYILKGSNGKFYKGITNNIEKRLYQHKLGQNKTTKNMVSFELIHVELSKNRIEARKLEKFLKNGFGREIIKELFNE